MWKVINQRCSPGKTTGRDAKHLALLLLVTSLIGAYLIATTTLIARDGVCYIRYAQHLATEPLETIANSSNIAPSSYTPGYPFLILSAHRIAVASGVPDGTRTWILSAQTVSLLCKVLAFIPLYYLGKQLIGPRMSFWGLMVLAILPGPAKSGSDALRDWPGLLLLATGFLLLMRAAKSRRVVLFGIVGAVAGIGYVIRPMCAQLIAYGVLWILWAIISRRVHGGDRYRLAAALGALLVGFVLMAGPYMIYARKIIPTALYATSIAPCETDGRSACLACLGFQPDLLLRAFCRIINKLDESLFHYFVPMLFIGAFRHPRSAQGWESRWLFRAFVICNVLMFFGRYCFGGFRFSSRYLLPLLAFSACFIAQGTWVLAGWTTGLVRKVRPVPDSQKTVRIVFAVLLAVGFVLCLPKLLHPIRRDKQGYVEAADWLRNNTPSDSLVAVPDNRIGLYADRRFLHVRGRRFPWEADYVVKIYGKNDKRMISADFPQLHTVSLDPAAERQIVIFRVAGSDPRKGDSP